VSRGFLSGWVATKRQAKTADKKKPCNDSRREEHEVQGLKKRSTEGFVELEKHSMLSRILMSTNILIASYLFNPLKNNHIKYFLGIDRQICAESGVGTRQKAITPGTAR
jgi:hypothetical protein